MKLLKYLNINKYTINLKKSIQIFYKLIYSLESKKLKTFNTDIKTNLANSFIQFF